jgi:hypothetical protein
MEIDAMSIAQRTWEPITATLPDSCPICHTDIAARLQLALESIRAEAKRPVMPDLLILCRRCQRPFVVSLQPVPEGGR